ncbi:MAG: DUF4112 domain-containing protein, partial [Flammeovirgaceae bacterium]|nr:DUF4112 domain-containing protein [Flammeovirgaceae bacterium]
PVIERFKLFSYFPDKSIRVPFTKYKFGIDPIMGFFPALGDAISLLISTLTLLAALRTGVERRVIFIMLGNLLLDFVVGSVPILGNIFDFVYKANTRNVSILQRYYATGEKPTVSKKTIVSMVFVIFSIVFLCIALTILLVWWLSNMLIKWVNSSNILNLSGL